MKLMNKLIIMASVAVAMGCGESLLAQNDIPDGPVIRKERAAKDNKSQLPNDMRLSNRARVFNDLLTQHTEGATWERIIYRRLDLNLEQNAPLYYPERPRDGLKSLFSTIFELMNAGSIKVYEYMDGYEIFDDAHELSFKDFLERTQIMYNQADKGSKYLYKVDPADVPTNNIKAYYLKEIWFFNPQNSTLAVKIMALCPIMTDLGDYGETVNTPLFWLPYDEIRPYLSQQPAMLSSLNNVRNATLDDYFRMGLYKGDIVMAMNLKDQALAQYCSSPDSIAKEQSRLENELKAFEKGLYCTQDSSWMKKADVKDKKKSRRSARSARASRSSRGKAPKASKAPKQKAVKPKKSSAGRSIRGRF